MSSHVVSWDCLGVKWKGSDMLKPLFINSESEGGFGGMSQQLMGVGRLCDAQSDINAADISMNKLMPNPRSSANSNKI